MGLYGDILRAADGSIFTFDKIVDFKKLDFNIMDFNSLTEEIIDKTVSNLAKDDGIFLGRYILLTEKLWVYVKTHDGTNYAYTKIAKLHSLNDLNESNTDEWIDIEEGKNGPYVGHADAGPQIGEIVSSSSDYYANYVSPIEEDIKGSALNFIYYDQKGHAFKGEVITEKPKKYYNGEEDFTLILNGGGFLTKYLTPEENNN